jgi:hypothetical protein
MVKVLIIIILVTQIFSPAIITGIDSKSGTAALSFLKIGVGARPVAMGESYVGISDDSTALYWNPAGLAQIERLQGTFMHNMWLENIIYDYIGAVSPLEQFSEIFIGYIGGISITTLNTGTIEGYDINNNPYNYSASDFAIGISIAKIIAYDQIFVGSTFKYISEQIESCNGATFGIDIGGIYKLSYQLSLGAAIQNIGPGIKFVSQEHSQPMNIKIGLGYKSPEYLDHPYIVAIDLNKPIDNTFRLSFGGEYTLNPIFKIRAGYKLGSFDDLDGLTGFTFGFGTNFVVGTGTGLFVDCAFAPYGNLGSTFRISVTLKF